MHVRCFRGLTADTDSGVKLLSHQPLFTSQFPFSLPSSFLKTSTPLSKMTLQPVLPNELMLLIFKHQTTISDLLALSSTSRDMRSLFLDNASTILFAVCKNSDLLSAAKVLVDVISEVANQPTQLCVCPPIEEYHFHKNVANQHYIADGLAPYPTELRDLRTTSRALNTAMLVANKAIDFWTAKACPVDHKLPTVDKEKFMLAYLLLWVCAESHFSSELDARARKLGLQLRYCEKLLLRELYEFSAYDLDRPTKLSIGSADPDHDEEDIEIERPWFQHMGGRREDVTREYETNCVEWCFWGYSRGDTWRGVCIPYGLVTEWEGDKPAGCWCPTGAWIKWDLVQLDWWHTWDRMA